MSVILLVVLTNFILTFLFCLVSVASHSIRHLLGFCGTFYLTALFIVGCAIFTLYHVAVGQRFPL